MTATKQYNYKNIKMNGIGITYFSNGKMKQKRTCRNDMLIEEFEFGLWQNMIKHFKNSS